MRRALPLVVVLGLVGCSDFLTTEPKGQLTTENFFTTADQAKEATNATYAMLRNWQVHVFAYLGMTDITSDDATKGSTPSDAGFLGELDAIVFDPGNGAFNDTWQGYYQGIYRANVAIQNIPNIDMDATLRARLVAENEFLRAYYYFFLVRSFGGVPLITAPLKPGEYYQDRATAEAVYAQIEQDLLDAIDALPVRSAYSAADMGRATKGAAQALLAKVYLYEGKYQEALTQAQAVISSGEYSLYPSYAGIFSPAGENSSESVFSVQTIALEGGNNGPSGGASQYAEVQGVRGTPNLGWGFNTPAPGLESSYEPGDPRLEATIMYPWELLPDGSGLVVYKNPNMLNNRYNQKVAQSVSNPGGNGNSGVNIRLIRYADVLLIGAEAAQRTGNDGQAQMWLNMVRQRARGSRTVTLGFQPETLANDIASELGLSTDSRVFVRFVNPTTQAYAAGLRSFASTNNGALSPIPVQVDTMDVITSVEGMPITDMASYVNAVESLSAGGTATVNFMRVMDPTGGSPSATPMSVEVPVVALLPDVNAAGQGLLDAIWHERRSELAMEQHRFFDIVRQGRAAQVMESLTCADRALPAGCTPILVRRSEHPVPDPGG